METLTHWLLLPPIALGPAAYEHWPEQWQGNTLLRIPSLTKDQEFPDFQALCQYYAQYIQQHHPADGYVLIGWSLGATLALALCQCLPVRYILGLDPPLMTRHPGLFWRYRLLTNEAIKKELPTKTQSWLESLSEKEQQDFFTCTKRELKCFIEAYLLPTSTPAICLTASTYRWKKNSLRKHYFPNGEWLEVAGDHFALVENFASLIPHLNTIDEALN